MEDERDANRCGRGAGSVRAGGVSVAANVISVSSNQPEASRRASALPAPDVRRNVPLDGAGAGFATAGGLTVCAASEVMAPNCAESNSSTYGSSNNSTERNVAEAQNTNRPHSMPLAIDLINIASSSVRPFIDLLTCRSESQAVASTSR